MIKIMKANIRKKTHSPIGKTEIHIRKFNIRKTKIQYPTHPNVVAVQLLNIQYNSILEACEQNC